MKRKRSYQADEGEENFVRRNLRNKRGVGKKGNRVSSSRRPHRGPPDRESTTGTGEGERNKQFGLAALGLDPLQMSLDAVAGSSDLLRGRSEHKPKRTDSVPFKEKIIRGLHVSKAQSYRNSSKCEYPDSVLEQLAPQCAAHQQPTRLLTVSKVGANKGRKFYGCMFPVEQRCNFFMWAEDNPALVASTAKTESDISLSWEENALAIYEKKISQFSLVELKKMIKSLNNRLRFGNLGPLLTQSGTKDELVLKIVNEERSQLATHSALIGSLVPQENTKRIDSIGADVSLVPNEILDISSVNDFTGNEVDIDDISLEDSESESDDHLSNENLYVEEKKQEEKNEPVELPALPMRGCDAVDVVRKCFGFSCFRAAQEWAVSRCMSGLNSLLVMPTGSGKSLCYMVPAILLPGLTVVVSPLIALMQDQMKKLPVFLPGACLSGEVSANDMAKTTSAILHGRLKILYVSPERLCTNAFRQLIINLQRSSSLDHPVSLLCVDEAHCMSSWSYNFRPAFLRIRREIEHLKPRSILALTATAPPYIQQDIMGDLRIPADGLSTAPYCRNN